MFEGESGKIIAPDFDAMKQGKSVYVEAKIKSQSICFRMRKQERHGINIDHFSNYVKAADESGKPVAIMLVECQRNKIEYELEWSGSLLVASIKDLRTPLKSDDIRDVKLYWPRKIFSDINSFTAVELFKLANGELTENASFELDRIFFGAPAQLNLF